MPSVIGLQRATCRLVYPDGSCLAGHSPGCQHHNPDRDEQELGVTH